MLKFKNGLAKDPSTGTWLYCFKINGKNQKGSTRAKDRLTAEKILSEKRRETILEHRGLQSRIPTVSELLKLWHEAHQGIHSQNHLKSVEGIMRLWVLPLMGETRIDRVNTSMMEEARQGILEAGRSPLTGNLMVRSARLLWRYAVRIGYIDRVPFQFHEMRVQRKPRPTVPAARIQEFFAAVDATCQNPQARLMFRVMVGLGLRQSEALGMRWEWFDAAQRTYCVGLAKGKEARVIPVPSWLWRALHESTPRTLSEWVFPAHDFKPHRPNFLQKPLETIAKKLGLGHLTHDPKPENQTRDYVNFGPWRAS